MGIGDWGLGIGDWGLGIGDWAQSPIPIPISKYYKILIFKYFFVKVNLNENKLFKLF